jgi:hypothetical protein
LNSKYGKEVELELYKHIENDGPKEKIFEMLSKENQAIISMKGGA